MSIINAIISRPMDSIASAFRANDITSDQMKNAIGDWYDLYFNNVATEKEDPCQQIPHTIVRKLTKTAFSEYSASSQDSFTQDILNSLDQRRGEAMQVALIGGESLLKPVPVGDRFRFGVVDRKQVLVFARDADGNMTDIGTAEQTVTERYYYSLLERRTVDNKGFLTIQNMLYRSGSKETLGQQVPLGELPRYADFPDRYTFPLPVGSVGLASLKTPVFNCVDGSNDGVSVYAAAVGLIHNINRNEAQLNGEFERGESRIIVSSDMLKQDKHGRKTFADHVFTGLDDDQDTVGVNIFSPTLRDASFLNRKQEYLRNVENVIGLKRGLLSEVEAAERTATEITSSEGDYNLTIVEFQQAWEKTVREAVRICGILGQMYRVPGAHEIADDEVTFDWGNGVLFDEEKTWEDMKDQVARGLLKPEIAVGWRYGMPYETEAQRKKIRAKYMPDVIDEGGGE